MPKTIFETSRPGRRGHRFDGEPAPPPSQVPDAYLRDANAGDILQQVLGSNQAGGHDMIAGGRVPLPQGEDGWEEAAARIKKRLLSALDVADCDPTELVG